MNTPARYTIDLRVEQDRIRSELLSAVRRYATHFPQQPLTAIELQYSANSGFVYFNLDTRPEHEPGDLGAMRYYGFAKIDCAHWRELADWPDDEPVEIITHTGELVLCHSLKFELMAFGRALGICLPPNHLRVRRSCFANPNS